MARKCREKKTKPSNWPTIVSWIRSFWNRITRNRQREEEQNQELVTEPAVQQLIKNGKFLEAFKYFKWSDQAEDGSKAALLKFLKQEMEKAVETAFQTGDRAYPEKPKSGDGLRLRHAEGPQEKIRSDEESEDSMSISSNGWDSDLEELFRKYAELQIPPFGQDLSQKIDAYLEELNNHIRKNLTGQREGNLCVLYSKCFQDVLLSRLNMIAFEKPSLADLCQVYNWASCNIFAKGEKRGQAKAQEQDSLDSIKFCSFLTQLEQEILRLVQIQLEEKLKNVMDINRKTPVAQLPNPFSDCYMLVNDTIKNIGVLGDSITSKAKVQCLQTFSHFLKSYVQEAKGLLQHQANREHSQEFKILENCCTLKTCLGFIKKYHSSPKLNSTMDEDLKTIEEMTRNQLLQRFTDTLQESLKDHFQAMNGDLRRVLKLINDNVSLCKRIQTPNFPYKTLLRCFFERAVKAYIEVLFSHLSSNERSFRTSRSKIPPNVKADWQSLKTCFPMDLNPKSDSEDPVLKVLELLEMSDGEMKQSGFRALQQKFPFLSSIQGRGEFCENETTSLLEMTEEDGMEVSCCCCCCCRRKVRNPQIHYKPLA
ncbi:uncharacterized protein LOC119933247 [Tachyglossus aculeatus]|uniref:uncharacterized protein LOC119933247 n=1 Tax=Tachyglossus aculeatus TaxID=9261 RepID=UPI0018F31519|nr:uncharacterized protein LOC119933247 [Tachyglossus aculeatus]